MEERIREILEGMTADEYVQVWNDYCDKNRYTDDMVYSMTEFDYLYETFSPLEIVRAVEGNSFNSDDDYFVTTIYGVKSSCDPLSLTYIDGLIDDIERDRDDFGVSEIRELFEEEE